ncbi:uncharacterized protein LOC108222882 isoform X2 [Daucus carota subsp. sativus]|uniref:uncharacterized protein LOC108222882 isoform X2 n=1 Tax=Daucus carota subsp. sativus TaxID=79200 RepID=UPI0007EF4509|nr:PREDICTED: uncharacterized protein LOC108222882 isoform X2 [Daucus carota subsp. sativus]
MKHHSTSGNQGKDCFSFGTNCSAMAQLSDSFKSSNSFQTPPSTYKSPQAEVAKVEELLPADGAMHQSPLTSGKHNDYDGGDPAPNRKSSVLNKFRDKAKKLKSTLSSKRIRQSNIDSEYDHETESKNGIDNEDDDDKTIRSMEVNLDEDEIDEDPEYLGAPIYESVQAPQECKEYVKQHPREVTASADKHIIESCAKNAARKASEPALKTVTETVSEKLVPAYNAVSTATQAITSKISSLTVETTGLTNKTSDGSSGDASSESRGQIRNSGPPMYDKGVSVKEYLMQKLEPGEDEKALSQVITDAISPKGSEQVGVVGMVKDAVTSYLQPSSDSATKAAESLGKTNVSKDQNVLSNKASNVSTDQNSSSNKASNVSTDQKTSSNKAFTASKTFNTRHDPAYKASEQNAPAADTKSYSLSESSVDANKLKSKSCNATANLKLSAFIPISTNSEEGNKAENHGKVLQTN